MGHTKPSDLKDLQDELESLRRWDFIKEKSPNVFYFKSKPFLHFHDKDGKRWADILDGHDWGVPVDVPFEASRKAKTLFLKEARTRYLKLLVR
jgi:hypothetical protein